MDMRQIAIFNNFLNVMLQVGMDITPYISDETLGKMAEYITTIDEEYALQVTIDMFIEARDHFEANFADATAQKEGE